MTDNLLDQSNDDSDYVNIDPNKDYLSELVGDGKKFATPQDLAKSKFMSDSYITILERKMDELRSDHTRLSEEYKARAKLEELVDQLANRQPQNSTEPLNTDVTQKPSFDLKEVESLVSNKIQEIETSKKQNENFNLVKNKLKEKYGNNYQAVLKEHMETLGLTDSFVNDLAKNHPTVLFKTLGLDSETKRETFQAPPPPSQRFSPKGPEMRTWSYYQRMKKDNPKLYNDPKTTVQMHHDAIELGAAFKDGDWGSI